MSTIGTHVSGLLGDFTPPEDLLRTLAGKWKLPPMKRGIGSRSRASFDVDTGVMAEDGAILHAFMLPLVERSAVGLKGLAFLIVSKAGEVEPIHSLFAVRVEEYEGSPEIWGIKGGILVDANYISSDLVGFCIQHLFFRRVQQRL